MKSAKYPAKSLSGHLVKPTTPYSIGQRVRVYAPDLRQWPVQATADDQWRMILEGGTVVTPSRYEPEKVQVDFGPPLGVLSMEARELVAVTETEGHA
jgi:hypothetical protein